MIRMYTPIFLLQMFCLYHAYQRKQQLIWYFAIIFFPLLGSVAYLYVHFYSQKNVDSVTDNLTKLVNKNHKIEELEKELKYADTIHNRNLLADEYSRVGDYEEAYSLYKSCLEGAYINDDDLLKKLTLHSYYLEDFKSSVLYGERVLESAFLEGREEAIAYAWSLHHVGAQERAEEVFKRFNQRFCNYAHRLQYAEFLIRQDRLQESETLMEDMLDEIDSMDREEKRRRNGIKRQIEQALKGIQ